MRRYKRNSGFTLMETLIYIAIIGGIAATFISFSLNISGAREKTYGLQEVHANARMAIDTISKKIKAATAVNTTSSVFNSDPGVLVLTMASSTVNPTVINLSSSTRALQIKEGTSAPVAITSEFTRVANLVFTNLSASSTKANIRVNITMSTASSTGSTNNIQNLETAVSTRL